MMRPVVLDQCAAILFDVFATTCTVCFNMANSDRVARWWEIWQMLPKISSAIFFHVKNLPFFKNQLPVLTKQSILVYISSEYPNFRKKIH